MAVASMHLGCICTAGLDAQIRFSDYIRFLFEDLLTSSFKSDPYPIFAFTLTLLKLPNADFLTREIKQNRTKFNGCRCE